MVAGDKVKLSCFDGSHVFIWCHDGWWFFARNFYSGVHYQVPFVGYRSSNPILQAADTITKIISDKPFEFKFEDSEGNLVSNADPKYSNKIKIIQITGSWCPNCKDESEFIQSYLQSNPSDELAVFALAFERHKERDKALERIRNYKNTWTSTIQCYEQELQTEIRHPLLFHKLMELKRIQPCCSSIEKSNCKSPYRFWWTSNFNVWII